ncbi:MAG: archaellin/type IV pilin N-terminal domain-containing protein, partial [Promethearchaeota archaeon]
MKLKFQKRRGVSEVISTVLILAITMVGAVFVSSLVQDTMISGTDQLPHSDINPNSVRLTAYDTRDSTGLSGISSLNNYFNQTLCTVGCQSNANNVPSLVNGGTEFIIIQIRNTNINPVFLQTIYVNNVAHNWDGNTANKQFDASIDDTTGKYPTNGKFSIIPNSNDPPIVQRSSFEINGDEEVRVIIKLSEQFSKDIEMWRPMQLHLDFGAPESTEFIIL